MDGTRDKDTEPIKAKPVANSEGGPGQDARVVETMDIARIMQALPHRFPFLLVDRVVDLRLGHSAVGIKNVTVNEYFFQGHFPGRPVMPGVLIIESMAQTGAVMVMETLGPKAAGNVVYFMSIEQAKFRRPVVPGDQLRIHVEKERSRGNVWKIRAVAKVDDISVAEAIFTAMIVYSESSA